MLASNIDEVIEILGTILDHEKDENSPLGYFAALYRKVTIEVKHKIGENYFDDGPRMEKLDVVFANRYLKAYSDFKDKEPITSSWRLAFEASRNDYIIVLQHLFLGMNAHISLDLGIAAEEISKPADILDLEDDFNKINEILKSLIDDTQSRISKIWPLLKTIDWLSGKWDEALADFSIDIARRAAWQVALDLSQIADGVGRETYIHKRDVEVTRFGNKIYKPGKLLSVLLTIISWTERGQPRDRIEILE